MTTSCQFTFKMVHISVLLTVLSLSSVVSLPNGGSDARTMLLRSHHKGKRAWDLPYESETQDDPVLSLVQEGELPEESTTTPSMWIDIGKDFVDNKEISLNGDDSLECEAAGSPPPKIFWLKDGLPIESMTIVTSEDTVRNRIEFGNSVLSDKFGQSGIANVKARLPINCAQKEDAGLYTCVAVNRGKQVMRSTRLTVIDSDTAPASRGNCEYRSAVLSFKKSKKGLSPFITSSESFHMETIGRNIVLPCRSVGKPRPQITWMDQDGKTVVYGKKYQVSSSGSLVLRNLAWKDMGVYTCTSENLLGKDTATTFVYPLAVETDES